MATITIEWTAPDDPAAVVLAQEQQGELKATGAHVPRALHDDIEFAVLRVDGEPAACGALARVHDKTAEIKRMYVRPAARRQGLARIILETLENRARDRGYAALRLETARAFTAAVTLYASAGYQEIQPWGEYIGHPISYCMQKALDAGEAEAR